MKAREGWDMIFTARVGARSSDFWQMKKAMEDLMARGRILAEQSGEGEPKEK